MKVLIVDDREDSRYLLETLLKGKGYGVESASNGAEALEHLKAGGIDLVISDILMPVMDGFQLCRRIKSNEALRHIPIIVYTATYTGPKDEEFALKIGANRFIVKPCEPDVIIDAIQNVMKSAQNQNITPQTETEPEAEMLKLYNERLVRKIEEKMLQLEKEMQMRRDTEKELLRTNSFLDSIVENIPDMIVLKDAEERRFIRCNKAMEDILGYSRDELLNKRDYDFFPKEQADFFAEQDTKVLSTKEIVDTPEEELLTRNKGKRILHTKKVPIMNEKGNPLYILGISEDITELKFAEAERNRLNTYLLQAQKLESLGNLAGGIAHDFNNILSVIIGYTEIALYDLPKGSEAENNIQEVYKAGMRAKNLVKQILTFARQTDEEIKPIKAKPIIKETLNFLRSSIPTTIEIKQNIISDSIIMGNPTHLHQVLMNLCTNSAQAMEENGGILEVSLDDIRWDKESAIQGKEMMPGDYIRLRVSDTGTGISPEIIGSIFDPYYTTKKIGEGTGLGLALVNSIVESYGGKVGVKSELGVGSIFSVYIPITNNDNNFPTTQSEVMPVGSERILFVDDETPILKVNSQILHHLGYKVTSMTSSNEALELFRHHPNDFDLVITDMTMPNMTGDKLAIELMIIRPDIPIILCTGYNKKISEEHIKKIGIKELAFKPFVKSDLAKTIRRVLDKTSVTASNK